MNLSVEFSLVMAYDDISFKILNVNDTIKPKIGSLEFIQLIVFILFHFSNNIIGNNTSSLLLSMFSFNVERKNQKL